MPPHTTLSLKSVVTSLKSVELYYNTFTKMFRIAVMDYNTANFITTPD